MQVALGTPFSATLIDPPGGEANLGARIEMPYTREIVSYWRPATLENGVWSVITEPPLESGEYLLVWRSSAPEPPSYEVFIPLVVVMPVASGSATFPALDLDEIRPTVEEVSNLERTRAIAEGGKEVDAFSEDTRPSYDDVEELINQAAPLVAVEFPPRVPEGQWEAIRHCVALYTALLIEGSFFREEEDRGSVALWRTLYNTAVLNTNRAIERDTKLAYKPSGLEAWRPHSYRTMVQ